MAPQVISREDYAALAAFRKALRKFLRFAEDEARRAGLTPQQHQVLLAVRSNADRDWVSVGEIAECLQLRHHAAVGLLDRCAARGWVERSPDPEDRRIVRITLTERGAAILEQITARNLVELKALGVLAKDLEALASN